jgi:hypothetical protein
MNPVRMLLAGAAATLLSACQTFPRYIPPTQDVAYVDVSRSQVTAVCTGGRGYTVAATPGKKLAVPVNAGPVTLYAFLYIQDYNVSYSCYPGLSFQPEAGAEYLFNMEIDAQACFPEIYRKAEGNRTGLAIEPSAGKPGTCAMPGK